MLKIENFSAGFSENNLLFSDISLTVNESEIVLITGKTGTGKTTLFKAIAGIIPYVEPFYVRGKITKKKKAGLLFQNPDTQIIGTTVREDIFLTINSVISSERKQKESFEQIVSLFDLEELLDKNTEILSGGERQKLAIATLYASGSEILLLDEPLSQLDKPSRNIVIKTIDTLRQETNTAIIITDHRPWRLRSLSDSVYVLETTLKEGSSRLLIPEIEPPKRSIPKPKYLFSDRIIININNSIKEIDIEIESGNIYWLNGPNGSGKTTLLKRLYSILSKKYSTSFILQNQANQLLETKVEYEIPGPQRFREKVLREFYLYHRKNHIPYTLSTGEKALLCAASVFSRKHQIYLLDEPFWGLDIDKTMFIVNKIVNLANNGSAFIISSHDEAIMKELSDKVIWL